MECRLVSVVYYTETHVIYRIEGLHSPLHTRAILTIVIATDLVARIREFVCYVKNQNQGVNR